MTIPQLQPLMTSQWPQDMPPGMLRRPSTPRDNGSKVHTKTALFRDVRGGRVFGDRVAPCECAAVCVRARGWTIGYPFAESRTPPDIATPSHTRQIPLRSDTASGIQRDVQVARYRVS